MTAAKDFEYLEVNDSDDRKFVCTQGKIHLTLFKEQKFIFLIETAEVCLRFKLFSVVFSTKI